jgi:hypothetical protein
VVFVSAATGRRGVCGFSVGLGRWPQPLAVLQAGSYFTSFFCLFADPSRFCHLPRCCRLHHLLPGEPLAWSPPAWGCGAAPNPRLLPPAFAQLRGAPGTSKPASPSHATLCPPAPCVPCCSPASSTAPTPRRCTAPPAAASTTVGSAVRLRAHHLPPAADMRGRFKGLAERAHSRQCTSVSGPAAPHSSAHSPPPTCSCACVQA